jgi:hypothetical protein
VEAALFFPQFRYIRAAWRERREFCLEGLLDTLGIGRIQPVLFRKVTVRPKCGVIAGAKIVQFPEKSIALTWLPIVALMLMKESSDPALQLSCVVQLANGNGVFKEFMLDIRR